MSNFFEIERKFLVNMHKFPYDLETLEKREIEQGYLLYKPEIRVRKEDTKCFMMIKENTESSLTRKEITFNLTKDAYEQIIKKKDINVISKTRYIVPENGRKLEVDVFKGKLEGLTFMEIEFRSEEDARAFKVPSWIEKEVTGDFKYKNSELAKNLIPNF